MSEPAVALSVDGAVATITLNRPAAGNSIGLPLARELLAAADRCAGDGSIRCVVLTGAGRMFCAGGDIGGFGTAGDGIAAYLGELVEVLHRAVSRLMRMEKPLLTLVNGPAAGAGMSLAIAGDIVLAAQSAHFTAAYGGVGLTPDGGMSWLLPRLVGMRRAQEMIIANRRVGAEEAAAIGLVTRVVADAELAAEGARQAEALAALAMGSVAGARALLLASHEGTLEEQLAREARHIVAAGGSAECREGVAAFLGRRRPDFRGALPRM